VLAAGVAAWSARGIRTEEPSGASEPVL
jgi:hypothetical protein